MQLTRPSFPASSSILQPLVGVRTVIHARNRSKVTAIATERNSAHPCFITHWVQLSMHIGDTVLPPSARASETVAYFPAGLLHCYLVEAGAHFCNCDAVGVAKKERDTDRQTDRHTAKKIHKSPGQKNNACRGDCIQKCKRCELTTDSQSSSWLMVTSASKEQRML
mgnify:CR=1 FL=1